MSDTKVKINLKEGMIEIEGTESFVEKHWEEIVALIGNSTMYVANGGDDGGDENGAKPKAKKISGKRKEISTTPIPLDIKKDDKKPSLKEFYDSKQPKNDMEKLTLFAHYMKKYLDIPDMEAGHAMFCYSSMQQKRPTNILSAYTNVIHRTGWLSAGSKPYTVTTSIAGDDHVHLEMPSTKEQPK